VLTNRRGGTLDDLIVANHGDHLILVVNAARKVFDETHLRSQLSTCTVEPLLDRALVALQGPVAEAVLEALAPEVSALRFMDVRAVTVTGGNVLCIALRLYRRGRVRDQAPANVAEPLCDALLRHPAVAPIGLGARDSLRLEAGLCLYGADLDETTTPSRRRWIGQSARRAALAVSAPAAFRGPK